MLPAVRSPSCCFVHSPNPRRKSSSSYFTGNRPWSLVASTTTSVRKPTSSSVAGLTSTVRCNHGQPLVSFQFSTRGRWGAEDRQPLNGTKRERRRGPRTLERDTQWWRRGVELLTHALQRRLRCSRLSAQADPERGLDR